MKQDFTVKKKQYLSKKKFVQGVSPEKKNSNISQSFSLKFNVNADITHHARDNFALVTRGTSLNRKQRIVYVIVRCSWKFGGSARYSLKFSACNGSCCHNANFDVSKNSSRLNSTGKFITVFFSNSASYFYNFHVTPSLQRNLLRMRSVYAWNCASEMVKVIIFSFQFFLEKKFTHLNFNSKLK